MRRFFIPAFYFPLMCLGMNEAEFNSACTNISRSLENASYYVNWMNTQLNAQKDEANSLLSSYLSASSSSPYNQGKYDGARVMYETLVTNYDNQFAAVNSALQSAQSSLNSLRFSDYGEAISNYTFQTWQTAERIDLDMTNGFQRAYDELRNLGTDLNSLSVFFNARSDMDFPIQFQDLADLLFEWASDAMTVYGMFMEIQSEFQRYFSLVNSRIEHPDSSLGADLNQMWLNCLANLNNVLSDPSRYHPHVQTSFLSSDSNLRLSNEGMIMAEQLAFQQRNYLCSVEALRALQAMTNQVQNLLTVTNKSNSAQIDLGPITNYLYDIQSTFYKEFNKVGMSFNLNPDRNQPYTSNVIHNFTNFTALAYQLQNGITSSRLTSARAGFANWRINYTNFFDRLEFYLLNLQGYIPDPSSPSSLSSSSLSETSFNSNVSQSTNSLSAVMSELDNVKTGFDSVKDSFKELLQSFELEGDGQFSVIQLSPSFTMAGIEFPPFEIPYSDIENIVSACRIVFQSLWYLVFGFIGYRLVFLVVTLFLKTVTHTVLIVSTLLSST